MSSLILPLLGVVVVSTGVVLVALASPVVPWVRAQTAALRARVESAESAEGSEDAEFSRRSGRGEASGARADEGADGTADEVSSGDDRADDDRADGDRAGDDGDGDADEDAHADDDRAAGDDHAAEDDHGGHDPDSRTTGIDGGVSRPSGR